MAQRNGESNWVGLEIRHLAALEAVAREGSFRGAAQRLGYVQSAISHQILALERVVGTTLVQRTRGSRQSALTPAGEAVLEHASAILGRVRAAQVGPRGDRAGAGRRLPRRVVPEPRVALLVTPILPRLRAALSVGSITFVEHETGRRHAGARARPRRRRRVHAASDPPARRRARRSARRSVRRRSCRPASLAARRGRPMTLEEIAQSGLVAHGPSRHARSRTSSPPAGSRPIDPVPLGQQRRRCTRSSPPRSAARCLPRLAAVSSPGVTVLPLDPERRGAAAPARRRVAPRARRRRAR